MAAPPSASYQLPPEWADYLKARGVPPDVAAERGYQVVLSGKPLDGDFAASWGFNQKYSGLLIPLHGILNKSAVQLRLAHPEDFAEGSGKAPRFRQPAKQPNVLITHPRTRAALTQPGEIIFVAEGATRVDVLAAYSIPAVGILGINNWKGGKPPVAIADFDALGIKGNRFVIVPDGDVRVNKNVNRATSRLATFLRGRGADAVHILAVPGDKGLDDWLAAEHFPDKDAVLHAILAHVVSETPKVQVSVPDAGAAFAVDNAGAWACTPVADARRVLEYQPEKLCVVRGTNGGEWRLLVEQKGGRWSASRDIAALSEMHIESALRWQRQVSTAVMAGKLDEDHAKNCTRWAIQSAKPQGVKDLLGMVGATVRYLETLDMWSGEVVSCDEDDIDADRLCIGAPNGVVCLKSGKLLPAKEARKRFVTRHIPDDFDSEAVHPYADALVAHLTAEDKRYLLSALGFALRGNPARRLYGLAGSKGGAKSTLLNAIVAALGDVKRTGYGMRLDVEALLLTRWTGGKSAHQGQLIGLQDARIAVTEEPPANQRFNTALLKDLSGGLVQQMREVGEKAGPARPATATMFIAMNHGQEDALDTSDEALADRARLLRYPKLTAAEVDPERISDVTTIRKVRQAVVALLVKWAAETPKRPEAPLSVQAFTEQRRQESIGAVGQYIQANVKVTSRRTDYMSVKQLMDELGEAIGKTNDRIEGMTQREVLALMRELVPDLPRATNKRGRRAHISRRHTGRPGCQSQGSALSKMRSREGGA